jgi:hypothetical protein
MVVQQRTASRATDRYPKIRFHSKNSARSPGSFNQCGIIRLFSH